MKTTGCLTVATDFSQFPAGRNVKEGPRSGESFCDEFLVPALLAHLHLTVVLDGTMGYGSSWLDGAFGRLVHHHKFDPADLRKRMKLQSLNDPSIEDEIWSYIERT
jgi:hypothetical protein